jgi:hypothetical protein
MAHVHTIVLKYAIIGEKSFVELMTPHVVCSNPAGIALQDTIRETTRRRARIKHRALSDVDGEMIKRSVKFLASAADKPRTRTCDFDWLVTSDQAGHLVDDHSCNEHASALHQDSGFVSRSY